ncbi:uncharacterized protein FOMMEDRAFT_31186 [Fomitiporia mediterranea MF3/22]|uniref:uncharacterized protein n=1 Tax=Fomitiporia mediterranea (strain MF3/22) TaxID=694068 RepID=UPI0004408AAA|nr:uncharacterized protein FOMMEDRAFT_31186 [Fomitiporia mediterranea MF3/22]EJC99483.1 hypothetical protein FOMMEDRAFT_31186 [Fomitiporia mediterranea MF3/22]
MVDSPNTLSSTSNALTINDLPPDILDEILLHVPRVSQRDVPLQERDDLLWEEDVPFQESMRYLGTFLGDYPRSPPAETMLAPLRLAQVCRLWRDAATTLPALWTDVNVRLYRHNSEERDAWFVWAVDTWMERSKASPLRLSVECDTLDVSEWKFDVAVHILKKLLDHQNRWRVAHFAFIGHNPKELPQLHLVDAPILESLFVCWDGIAVDYSMSQVHLDFSSSPSLRSLHLTSYPHIEPGQLSGLRELSLHGTLSLYGHGVQRAFPLEIFRHMPNLEILKTRSLECTFHDLSENSQSPPIVLHELHTLVLCCDVVSRLIVKRLTLPALRRLILDHFPGDNIEELSVMLGRSQPPLEYLELSGRYFDERAYMHTLLLCPSVKTLCIVTSGRRQPHFVPKSREALYQELLLECVWRK